MSRGELLVVGGGPAGLAAAIAAARLGARVSLADEGALPGGQLRYRRRNIERAPGTVPERGAAIAERLLQEATAAGVAVLTDTTVWGAFGDGTFGASRGDEPTLLTPAATIVAAGSTDLPLVFPGGSLPGIFTARAALKLANEWGVLPGHRWAVVGDDLGDEVAQSIDAVGGEIVARVSASSRLEAHGATLLETLLVDGVAVSVDCVAICVGRQPDAALAMMSDIPFAYAADLGGYVPGLDAAGRTADPNLLVCGDAAGTCSPEIALAEGEIAGVAAAVELGLAGPDSLDTVLERFALLRADRVARRAELAATYVQPVR
jgi:NADPH-dependent 2,4-dienoyl-CoA reductase/sulfur reductase-like enzyme